MLIDMERNMDHAHAARITFNEVAALYDEARPGYPDAVFDDLVALAKLAPGARLLEIGAGTGHATLPMARRGFRIDCIELGEAMAERARARLTEFSGVTVTVADFDRWIPDAHYDLVFSATAYHWLDPATRIQRIAARLAPGGHLAIFRNHHVASGGNAEFESAVQRVYDDVLGDSAATARTTHRGLPRIKEIVPVESEEWRASGLFYTAEVRVYPWSERLSAGDYVRQLATHSDHRLLPEAVRTRLLTEIERLIDAEFGGIAIKHSITLLQVAAKIA